MCRSRQIGSRARTNRYPCWLMGIAGRERSPASPRFPAIAVIEIPRFLRIVSTKDGRPWKVVAEYREEGRSAKNTDRPELKRLMADVAAGKLDVVCVTKIDRITRSLIDFYELWGAFEK